MILKFLHIDGRTFSLDMNDDATIQQTKIALIYLYKLEYHALEFVINGRILNDDEIISRIGYFNSSYITFYEPALTDDIEEVPPYFGSTFLHHVLCSPFWNLQIYSVPLYVKSM